MPEGLCSPLGIGDIVYSDRQSSHMDLEVYMRDSFPQGSPQLLYVHRGLLGLQRLTGDGKSYPVIREDYQSMTEALCRLRPVNLAAIAMELVGILMVFESPQRSEKTIRRETQSFGEDWGNI